MARYWGAAGEQIDLLSGNLNFSIPLIQAQARGGSSAAFSLSYNSQIWRGTSAGTSNLGIDVGYGLGWKLQIGSILPVSNQYYLFTDSTGAHYHLDQNVSANVWTSRQGIYVSYDATAGKLYFPDGTFWVMGASSASGEADASTLYPTTIEDTNGNTIQIQYAAGAGSSSSNTSARITSITDVRATGSNASYSLSYNSDTPPHLSAITNTISTSESYSFTYTTTALAAPFGSGSFGNATLPTGITITGLNTSWALAYGTGTAELASVTNPSGGVLRWLYRTYNYSASGFTYREVANRQMQTSGAGATYTWNVTNDSNPSLHATATVVDLGAGTQKTWNFGAASGTFPGLATRYQEIDSNHAALVQKDYTWTQDSGGNVYLGSTITTLNPGTSYAAQTKSAQTLDIYGNATQSQIYDYGNPTSPSRTYTYTYLTGAGYASLYIRNRLATASVSGNGQSVTLATNSYDQNTPANQTGLTAHDSAYGTGWLVRGNLTQSVTPGAIRNTSYDIGGMPVSADDGYGHTLTINSSSSTNYAAPTSLLLNSSFQNTYTYNPSLAPASATDPNNNVAANSYDSFGRLSTTSTTTGMQTTYAYDYTQQTVSASAAPTWWPIGTPAHWSQTQTDGFGRTIRAQAGAASTSVLSIVDSQYAPCACSPLGKLSAVSAPYAPGATPVWTRYTYDGSGRTLSVTAPDGVSATTYQYLGNQTKITDPAGNWKTYTSDANGNLTQVAEPSNLVTTYTYDVLNHLTQVSMTRGSTTQTRTFTYNSTTQRLSSAQTPEAGTVQYAYNNDGTLQSKTDALAQTTAYQYDGFGRVTEADYSPANSAPDPCQQVKYTYDLYSHVTVTGPFSSGYPSANSPIGRLVATLWGGHTACPYQFLEEYAYDAQGKVFARALQITNTGNSATTPIVLASYFSYDAEGRLTVATYPAGTSLQPTQTITYTTDHDAMGRDLDMYTGTPQSPSWVVSSATYNAAGRLTQMNSDQFSETRTYNANLQLTSISATPNGGGSGINLTYTFPSANNGRISQMTDNLSGETVQYTYDQLNRLLSAASSTVGTMNFAYDGFGNLTQQGSTTLSVDATTNRINTSGYQYNANGNLVAAPGGATYAYDVSNRLVSNGAIYNPRNQRVFDGTYYYLYMPSGKVLGKYAVTWVQNAPSVALTVGQPNVYFAGRLLQEQGHWVMVDRLGSVRKSGTGESAEFNPYGDERTPLTSDGRTKFAGYFRDTEGQDYAMARYYSAGTGRFWSPDPGGMRSAHATDPTSWNRYAYVGGDPVNFIDPEGKFRCNPTVCEQPTDPIIDPTPTPPMPTPAPEPPARPKDATTDNSARFILRRRTANFGKSNCNKVFDAAIEEYTTTNFTNEINIDEFYNVNAAGISNLTQDQVSGNGNNTQLGAMKHTAETIINGSTRATLLGANFFSNTNSTFQGNVLLHELLHAYTGWDDAEIFAAFQGYGLSNPNGDTEDISAWLSTDCKSTPASVTWWQN